MIKIVCATRHRDYVLEIEFSDGSAGDYDLAPVLAKDTELRRPLLDPIYLDRFSLDLGALCWPNGLELSPETIHHRLSTAGSLRRAARVA